MRASQVEFQGQGQALSLIFFAEGDENNPAAAESWASHAPVWEAAGSPIFFSRGRTQDGRKNHFAGVLRARGRRSAGQREGEKRAISGCF